MSVHIDELVTLNVRLDIFHLFSLANGISMDVLLQIFLWARVLEVELMDF